MIESIEPIDNFNFGILRSCFNNINNKYINCLSKEEIAKYILLINSFTKREKIIVITRKINNILSGKIKNEELLHKEKCYLQLLLKSISFNKIEAEFYWQNKCKTSIYKKNKNVLIEAAAIHPLVDGKPGIEFKEHLELAIELFNIEKKAGNNPIIYVPGSLHYITNSKNNSIEIDAKPLSEAGKEFLIKEGIPEICIRANKSNIDIKKDEGVYNTSDECLVSTQIAKKENCGRIISIVSPVQIYRKALFYLEFGYIPEIYSTGSEKTMHNYIDEIFWSLYIIYRNDQDWQNGFMSYLTRKERDIDYLDKIKNYKEDIEKILDVGPGIPESVLEKKQLWVELYNIAKENMNLAKKRNKNILIDLMRVTENTSLELKRIEKLVKENNNCKVTLIYNSNVRDEDIINLFSKYSNVEISYIEKGNIDKIAQIFINGNYNKFLGMYPSYIAIDRVIEYVKKGILPTVSTLPDKKEDYIGYISKLYDNVLN